MFSLSHQLNDFAANAICGTWCGAQTVWSTSSTIDSLRYLSCFLSFIRSFISQYTILVAVAVVEKSNNASSTSTTDATTTTYSTLSSSSSNAASQHTPVQSEITMYVYFYFTKSCRRVLNIRCCSSRQLRMTTAQSDSLIRSSKWVKKERKQTISNRKLCKSICKSGECGDGVWHWPRRTARIRSDARSQGLISLLTQSNSNLMN